MTPYESDIIRRCTVDGLTRWSAVATMLGRPEPSVRAQFGALMQPSVLTCEPCEPEDHSLKSPYVRKLLRDRIAERLKLQSATAQTIAAALNAHIDTVKDTLSRMAKQGLVTHSNGRAPYLWSIAERDAA